MYYCYDIHGIVRVKSVVRLYELEYFATNSEFSDSDSDIVLRKMEESTNMVSLYGPSLKRNFVVEKSKHYDKIHYSEHLGSLGSQFFITFADGRIEIIVNNLIAKSMHVLYVNLVEPLLRFVLVAKGYVLLHSACICPRTQEAEDRHDDSGILLSAPPDTGKTTTVIKCVKNEFAFLSDDMTIIRPPNEAKCFPKPMTISSHTLHTAMNASIDGRAGSNNEGDGAVAKGRGLRFRSLIHSKNGRQFMRRLGARNVPIFTLNTIGQMVVKPPKFKIEELLPHVNIRESTKISSLYFLEKGGEEIESIMPDKALSKAIENSDDAFLFPPYKELLPHIKLGSLSSEELLQHEKKMLEDFLSNINCFIVRSDSRSWYNTVARFACGTIA